MRPIVMHYRDCVAMVEIDEGARLFHGRVVGMRDVLDFHGKTYDELESAFHETVDDYVSWCEEEGERPQKSWQGKMTFRPNDELRSRIAIAAAISGTSINAWMEMQLDRASREAVGAR